jgi:acetylornithine deacetylase/succinyl-diaminopimelate desuccinylase family protein
MSAVVELLQELVRIPSVNPQGDPGTPFTGEAEIARHLGDFMLQLGMEVELQFAEKDRPNVIGRLKSTHSRRHILLGPHTDTVSVGGMTIEPFGGELKDDRVWGRGSCDTKGPMASFLIALVELKKKRIKLEETDIWFVGLMGEESGNDGIEFLMESDFFRKRNVRLDFGIAGEPTDLKVVNRHKGALWIRIRAKGVACHASRPDLGQNAILKMREAIDFVQGDLIRKFGGLSDPVLGPSSFNITTIHGGSKVNIIPDACEIEIDHRSLPQESHTEVVEFFRTSLPDFEIEVISSRPGLDTDPQNPYIRNLLKVLSPSGNTAPFLVGAPWFADCSLMAKAGVPAIAFGPGSIQQAHTRDEFIEVKELERGVEVMTEFLCGLE